MVWGLDSDNSVTSLPKSFGGVVGGGLNMTYGTLYCISNPKKMVKVRVECPLVGSILAGGFGGYVPLPEVPNACGCNMKDLFGGALGATFSLGPASLDIGGCGAGGFSYGPALSKSWEEVPH